MRPDVLCRDVCAPRPVADMPKNGGSAPPAWLGSFRCMVVRYEGSLTIYQAFSHIARFAIVLRRALK